MWVFSLLYFRGRPPATAFLSNDYLLFFFAMPRYSARDGRTLAESSLASYNFFVRVFTTLGGAYARRAGRAAVAHQCK